MCLLSSMLIACGSARTQKIFVPEIKYISPPAYLMEEVKVPKFQGETNGDLVNHTLKLRDLLGLCNARFIAIKKSVQREKNK